MAAPALAQEPERAAVDRCYAANAARLDDGSSDARSIGTALLSTCSRERRAVISRLMGKPAEHPDVANTFLKSRDVALDRATEIVLLNRAERRKP